MFRSPRFTRPVSLALAAIAASLAAGAVQARGLLENPAPASTQSGIAAITGWHCDAREIHIRIDGHAALLAGSRTERNDTRATCGHAATGFSLLFNWNVLESGREHTITALADGVAFATARFRVSHFGVEYLSGKSGEYTLKNFPEIGTRTQLRWDEEKQGFTIVPAESTALPLGGTYAGWIVFQIRSAFCSPVPPTGHPADVRHASFVLDHRPDAPALLQVRYADGRSCTLPEDSLVAREPRPDGFLRMSFGPSAQCPEIRSGLWIEVDGERLRGDSRDHCMAAHLKGIQ